MNMYLNSMIKMRLKQKDQDGKNEEQEHW